MKVLTYGETSWTVGDEAAAAMMDYAVVLAERNTAATVEMSTIDDAGHEQTVALLVGPATMMTSGPSTVTKPEPDNTALIATIRSRIDESATPPFATPDSLPEPSYFDFEL